MILKGIRFLLIFLFTSVTVFSEVTQITSLDQFNKIVENANDRLLVFDLYADWCAPCKMLSPKLEKISNSEKESADFYKINVDKFPQLSKAFGVQGIPMVVFVKNKTGVDALTGLQPEKEYLNLIKKYSKDNLSSDTPKIQNVSAQEFAKLIISTTPLILDVRTENEYKDGHIPNSKLISVQDLEKRVSEISKYRERDILLYCRSGNRSRTASDILLRHNFKKVYNLETGIKGWIKAGYKTVK